MSRAADAGSVYSSKADLWLLALLGAVPVGLALAAALTKSLSFLVVAVLVLALYGVFVFPVRYTLAPAALRIRAGLFQTEIAYAQIQSVHPTRSPLSAPALSFDRLEIAYGASKTILISPQRQAKFIEALNARLPNSAR